MSSQKVVSKCTAKCFSERILTFPSNHSDDFAKLNLHPL